MLDTRRRVIGQLIVCQGCCCGATQKNRPNVPVEWMKDEWRKRGLLKRFQLTVSGCVGPCDAPNCCRSEFRRGLAMVRKHHPVQPIPLVG